MRFNPHTCPECGEPAMGTLEMIPGLALLDFDDDGNAEYSGETKVYWDGQTTELTENDCRLRTVRVPGFEGEYVVLIYPSTD